jgi:hypothetical protein
MQSSCQAASWTNERIIDAYLLELTTRQDLILCAKISLLPEYAPTITEIRESAEPTSFSRHNCESVNPIRCYILTSLENVSHHH